MTPQTIFFNEHERLRSGWRFTVFLISYIIFASFLTGIFVSILSKIPAATGQNSLLTMVGSFSIFTFCAIFLGWFYGKYFEDLPFRALGVWITKNWFKNLLLGLIVGTASIGLAALIPFLSGALSFQSNLSAGSSPILLTLSVTLLIFIAGAVSEEALFRGYLLQTMSRAKLFFVGVFLTSVLFASVHNANPGANLFSWLNTFLAGIWFCIAYWKTRDLWFPIGIHLAWNWVQGSILGINVSGLGELATAPLMRSQDFGPVWLTGGSYGLEAGISCTIALIVSSVAIWFLPFPKPTEEMLEMTSEEKPNRIGE
ncbi:type II CAAX endopeptidase family protein [soil metagenome]